MKKKPVVLALLLAAGRFTALKIRGIIILRGFGMFEEENKFYEENRETLREKYLGKRVVIVKDKVLGVYDTDTEAIDETSKTMELGEFCIKYIPVNPEEEYHRLLSFL